MTRSNNASTSSCLVRGSSLNIMSRCLAGMSMILVQNCRHVRCVTRSWASLRSVRFGILKLRLPDTTDSVATRHSRLPSRNWPCTQRSPLEIRLRASLKSSRSPNGARSGLSNGMCHLGGTWHKPAYGLAQFWRITKPRGASVAMKEASVNTDRCVPRVEHAPSASRRHKRGIRPPPEPVNCFVWAPTATVRPSIAIPLPAMAPAAFRLAAVSIQCVPAS